MGQTMLCGLWFCECSHEHRHHQSHPSLPAMFPHSRRPYQCQTPHVGRFGWPRALSQQLTAPTTPTAHHQCQPSLIPPPSVMLDDENQHPLIFQRSGHATPPLARWNPSKHLVLLTPVDELSVCMPQHIRTLVMCVSSHVTNSLSWI
jgi:hypothetical protein